jgi:hypothetical protein
LATLEPKALAVADDVRRLHLLVRELDGVVEHHLEGLPVLALVEGQVEDLTDLEDVPNEEFDVSTILQT